MIIVVIVSYNPDPRKLLETIYSLESQVDKIILVKNSAENLSLPESSKIDVIQLTNNFGIAYAQNRGIDLAKEQNADFILFSDQDTIYPADYVDNCSRSYNSYTKSKKIAAVVPLFYNENKQQMSQIMISKTKATPPIIGEVYELAHAISSGSFCPIEAILDIGTMNERMFIDYVDNEWCWRATKKGYVILCDTNIVIKHSMGDSYKSFMGRKFVVYSNFRYYFFFRNSFYLLFHSRLFTFVELINFLNYTNMKIMIFFITNGLKKENFRLLRKAVWKGIFNNFSLEEEVK